MSVQRYEERNVYYTRVCFYFKDLDKNWEDDPGGLSRGQEGDQESKTRLVEAEEDWMRPWMI